eukprot:TRINITY_DN3633_c0_g1_i10.p1 TRINITY_DN3633_c0_g1~~TRINITY_DN3633_c0_g1_i10.p1  ORF type:complete len:619 (+),score=175.66 TRINITY_DN3633_c0_g1_i10:263-2119(+)
MCEDRTPHVTVEMEQRKEPHAESGELPYADTKTVDADSEESNKATTGVHSMWSAVANFVNSIVGAGIIGLPFSVEEGGLGFTIVLLIVTGALTAYSVRLLIKLGEKMKVNDYELLCKSILGPAGYYAVTISMACFAYGGMLSYLIILGDTMYPVFTVWGIARYLGDSRELVIAVFGIFICLPLSSFKDIGVLGKTSAMSVFAAVVLVMIVVVRSVQVEDAFIGLEDKQLQWVSLAQKEGGWEYQSYCPVNVSESVTKVDSDGVFWSNFTVPADALGRTVAFQLYGGSFAGGACGVDVGAHDVLVKDDFGIDITQATGTASVSHPDVEVRWVGGGSVINFEVKANSKPYSGRSNSGYAAVHKNFFPAMGVVFFAYVCHHSSFLVKNSLKDPSDWPKVVNISIGFATALSLLISIAGYNTFLRCTRPNILNNFSPDADQTINFARFLLAFTMIFTFPMEFFVVRQAATTMFLKGNSSTIRHYVLTLIIFGVTLPPGVFLSSDQLGLVLEISGGLAASALGFILPGLMWFRFQRRYTNSPPPSTERTYVQYDSPSNKPEPVVEPSYLSLLCTKEAIPAACLLATGFSSLLVNTVLGFMHAAGIDTYENPSFCPDLGDYNFF